MSNPLRQLKNREEAGKELAEHLRAYAAHQDALVLALPRGGVPVGFEIAKALHLPLDVFLVRKLGMPGHEELAIGAIASGGVKVLNDSVLSYFPIDEATINRIVEKETKELERRTKAYRDDKPFPKIKGKHIILVDDGLATGSTMRAAIEAIQKQEPKRIIVAVPVAPPDIHSLFPQADETICLLAPESFHGVSSWYEHFNQTSDEEVQSLLHKAEKFPQAEAT